MSLYIDPRLDQAKRLLEQKNREAARALLRGLLAENHEDIEALFLYAFVAKTPADAEKMLRRVLQLDPLHYRAKAALNKLQRRSLEQLPPQRPAPDAQRAFPLAQLSLLAGGILLVVAVVAVILLVATGDDNPSGSTSAVAMENLSPTLAGTQFPTQAATLTLPPTWTPLPTHTTVATRTNAPTMTLRPTETIPPTFTPTAVTEVFIELNLGSLQRMFSEYRELAAQSSTTQDPQALVHIQEALRANIQGLELAKQQEGSAAWQTYADELILLLQSEYNLAISREKLLGLQQACGNVENCAEASEITDLTTHINQQLTIRLSHEETVDGQLFLLVSQYTATAEWEQRVDMLKTPSVTPIMLPSATPGG